jgi:uncharacterized protein YihD (DUF1040 family)
MTKSKSKAPLSSSPMLIPSSSSSSISSSMSTSATFNRNDIISSNNDDNDNNLSFLLERKVTLATEGFTTDKFCELVLRDRNRLSKENALTICDYVIVMKREVNPALSYKKYTIQFLAQLSKTVGTAKKFIDMTRDDVLLYLDKCRKPENEDPLHK